MSDVTHADDLTAKAMRWAQRMKAEGDEDLAAALAMWELQDRKSKGPRRRCGVKVRLANGRPAELDARLVKQAESDYWDRMNTIGPTPTQEARGGNHERKSKVPRVRHERPAGASAQLPDRKEHE